MIEFWRAWLRPVVSNQWVVVSLLGGLAILVLSFLVRSGLYIRRFGVVTWLKSAWRMDPETWRLIGVLMLFAMAAAMVFTQVL
ncbi:MAG TPA: hypothetical protein VKW04_19845 [Planctomycetota bacterium]|nr:hypothetical protein [Planctomycetota bacterium]